MADVFRPPKEENKQTSSTNVESFIKETENKFENANIDSKKEKIKKLRIEVTKKDQEIERERALRRAAEKRQLDTTWEETYVDLYAASNPSVNEELKERLSTKAKLNRLLGERKTPEKKPPAQSPKKMKRHRHTPSVPVKPETYPASDSLSSSSSIDQTGDQQSLKDELHKKKADKRGGHQRQNHAAGSFLSPPRHMHGPYNTWYEEAPFYPIGGYAIHSPWLSPHRIVHVNSSGSQSWPFEGQSLSSNENSQSVPNLQSPESPIQNGTQTTGTSPFHSTPISKDTRWSSSLNAMKYFRMPVNIQLNSSSCPDDLNQCENESSKHENTLEKSASVPNELGDGLPFLVAQLGIVKDQKSELSEKLSEAEKELESLQIKQTLCEAMMEAEIAAKGAAVVEEIFAAQKEHDDAILKRIRLANDERDYALDSAKKMAESKDDFDSGTEVNSTEEDGPGESAVHDLMERLIHADTNSEIRRYGSAIISRIGSTKDLTKRITSEEMRAIIEEKDSAVVQCKILEREIIHLKKTQEGGIYKRNNIEDLKQDLRASKKERDSALAKAQTLQEEIDNLKVYYNLHKSVSQESQLRDQFNSSLSNIEDQVKSRDKILSNIQKENSQLSAQMKTLVNERNLLASKVQQLEQENVHLKQDHQRQERLVGVLRKKLTEGTVQTVS